MMKIRMLVSLLALVSSGAALPCRAAGVPAAQKEGGFAIASWDWRLHGTGETKSWTAPDLPQAGGYSVRFRAALTDATDGGWFVVTLDGVSFRSIGSVFVIDGRNAAAPLESQLRDRRFHEFVFVVGRDAVRLAVDGDMLDPVGKNAGALHALSISAGKADVEIRDVEVAAGDASGRWIPKNQLINGGFEELANGYPVAWGTETFGKNNAEAIAEMDSFRRHCRVDEREAYEGRRSLLLWCESPDRPLEFGECWRRRLAGRGYVLSCHVKTDAPGTALEMLACQGYARLATKEVRPDGSWRRFELPFATTDGQNVRALFALRGKGKVWIDAVQLELGDTASAYVARPVPEPAPPANLPKVMDCFYSDRPDPGARKVHAPRMARVCPARNSYRLKSGEYFPFGFTTSSAFTGLAAYGRMLDVFRDCGFNYVNVREWGYPKTAEELRGILDEGERRGIKTTFYLDCDPATYEVNAERLAMLKTVRSHPGLLEVEMFDELHGKLPMEKRREQTERVRREMGPDVPVKYNEFDAGVVGRMDFSDADVASFDMYFVGNHEISCLYYLLRQHRDDNPSQVVTFYPQAAGHFTSNWLRDPTPDEVLAQAYIGYALECFNISWWIGVPLTEPVLPALVQAKRERDLIDPSRFLDGSPYPLSCRSRNDAVKFAARRSGNVVTVIAVNIENRANEADWTFPAPPRRIRPLIGEKPGELAGARLHDTFGPLERRVYVVEVPAGKQG